jgi:hypothetical protein
MKCSECNPECKHILPDGTPSEKCPRAILVRAAMIERFGTHTYNYYRPRRKTKGRK